MIQMHRKGALHVPLNHRPQRNKTGENNCLNTQELCKGNTLLPADIDLRGPGGNALL